ncbi:hypothetical protein TEA_018977 [Camellia sinensis var. sinensis]|uniref:Ribosomal RNA-processing protein 43 n=1 Tax=Camellia sinensis var. sinensis TaxID=542762 RepID=A0A4S4EF02_CAMSN|nr:hypothetical protein TEA_018977 [Camellia sinensis var. sinensis]
MAHEGLKWPVEELELDASHEEQMQSSSFTPYLSFSYKNVTAPPVGEHLQKLSLSDKSMKMGSANASSDLSSEVEVDAFRRLFPLRFHERHLLESIRPDARPLGKARDTTLALGAVASADGSALAKIGCTTMLAAIKMEIMTPTTESPDEGCIAIDFHMPPICSPIVRPGRPAEAAPVVSKHSGMINLKELSLVNGKAAWMAYLDIYCLDADGALFDAALLSAVAAFSHCKKTTNKEKHSVGCRGSRGKVSAQLRVASMKGTISSTSGLRISVEEEALSLSSSSPEAKARACGRNARKSPSSSCTSSQIENRRQWKHRRRICSCSCSGMINLKELSLVNGKAAWMAYLDIYCLDADGALFDAALLSAVAAFSNLQIPVVSLNDDGRIVVFSEENGGKLEKEPVNKEKRKLKLSRIPFSLTCILHKNYILADPTAEEESIMETLVTVVLDSSFQLVSLYKPGGPVLACTSAVQDCIALTRQRVKELQKILNEAISDMELRYFVQGNNPLNSSLSPDLMNLLNDPLWGLGISEASVMSFQSQPFRSSQFIEKWWKKCLLTLQTHIFWY